MTLGNQRAGTETTASRRNWLYRIGGVAAVIVMALLLVGILGVIIPLQDNWLIVLFKLNAGLGGVQADSLNVLNLLDIVIMALAGTALVALCAALWHISKIWSMVAACLAFLGMPLLVITHMAGRSGLLLGGLIISAALLRSDSFSRASATVGIVAGALLLLVGDIGTAIFASSTIIAIFIGIGYVLWIGWFMLMGRRLLWLSKANQK
jgi:hypothetical protein